MRHPDAISTNVEIMSNASWSILQKHLPSPPRDSNLENVYLEAYAYYYYCKGIRRFMEHDFTKARFMFFQAWKYRPFYLDSFARVMRTFLGHQINTVLRKLKKRSEGFFKIS
jgi:hypothetical protein